ncbi:MAG: hypothetical protein ACP5O1_05740 [Phycisphaerae bacterium]
MSQAASGSGFGPVDEKKSRRGKAETGGRMSQGGKPSGSPQNPQGTDPEDDQEVVPAGHIPEWLDRAFPWIASILIHLALALLIMFLIIAVAEPKLLKPHPIIVPQSMNQRFSLHPGKMSSAGAHNPLRQVRQDIKQLMSQHTHMSRTSVKSLLNSSATHSLDFIARGAEGGAANGGALASFGVPGGGMGSGPPTGFMGTGGGNATRIVYVIDHGGNLLVGLGQIKAALNRSVSRLVPIQQFGVIVFASHSRLLPPGFAHATNANKRALRQELKVLTPGLPNMDRYSYFATPFQMAFKLRPQIIYFLANGAIDPRLIKLIATLNKSHAVHIYTFAYADRHRHGVGALLLKKIATQNGGKYKFISRQMVGG